MSLPSSNRKLLTIGISTYNEAQQTLFLLLSSINNQIGVDFSQIEVVLVNDAGNTVLTDSFFKLFGNLNVKYTLLEKNVGIGMPRQHAIDHCNGEYIMFCDADDVLHNVGAISSIIEDIQVHRPDILVTSWMEELINENGHTYVQHENDTTWMHGKVYRVDYLKKNDIRFHPDLRIHEDSYFNSIAFFLTENIAYSPFITYVWKFNPDSITRRNGASYSYDSIPVFIRAIRLAVDNLESRSGISIEKLKDKIAHVFLYLYFLFQSHDWQTDFAIPYRKESEKTAKECFQDYAFLLERIDNIPELYNAERERAGNNLVECETFSQWMNRVFDYELSP